MDPGTSALLTDLYQLNMIQAYLDQDAHREGFSAVVIEDACRAIDVDGSAATRASLAALDVAGATARAVRVSVTGRG